MSQIRKIVGVSKASGVLLRRAAWSVLGVLACAAPAMAGGGTVLSATATPFGSAYSLPAVDAATAVYNTGVFAANPATPAAPNVPFKVLEGNTTVTNSQYFYLSVYFGDNSAPADPNFPASIANQTTDANYLNADVLANYNVTAFIVQVDGAAGTTTTLTNSYISGVNTPTLLDGTPGGNEYIISAAFLSPLTYGSHTIAYGGIISGAPVIFGTDNITVVPEPASMGLIGAAGAALMRRRKRA